MSQTGDTRTAYYSILSVPVPVIYLTSRIAITWAEVILLANSRGDSNSGLYIRLGWTAALLALLWCAVTVVCVTVQRYMRNPTYMTQLQSYQEVMPFPSVLIWPEVAFPEYRMNEFMSEIKLPQGLNATYIRSALGQLSTFISPDVPYSAKDLEMLQRVLDFNKLDIDTAARRLTSSCEETLIRCRLFGELVNCSQLFQMEPTSFGYTCFFNGRSLVRELRDNDIQIGKPPMKFFTDHVGPKSGLIVVVNQSQELNDIDISYKWLALQGGQRYVDVSVNGTPLSPGTELLAGFSTEGFRVSEDVISLSSELRGCRMSYEKLRYFPYRRKSHCVLECELAQTLSQCQCIRVTHPRPPGVAVCRARDLHCVAHASVSYGSNRCDCPPTCDVDLDYFTSQTLDLIPNTHPYDKFYKGLDFKKVSIVRAFLLAHGAKLYARQPYFDSVQLFSQLGGVFSMFFGCSILTVLELMQLMFYGLRGLWGRTQNSGMGPTIVIKKTKQCKQKKVRFQKESVERKVKKSKGKKPNKY